MSASGSAKARKLSGGHMGKAHLLRFGGRKRGKKSKRQWVTLREGEMENKKLKRVQNVRPPSDGWSKN